MKATLCVCVGGVLIKNYMNAPGKDTYIVLFTHSQYFAFTFLFLFELQECNGTKKAKKANIDWTFALRCAKHLHSYHMLYLTDPLEQLCPTI